MLAKCVNATPVPISNPVVIVICHLSIDQNPVRHDVAWGDACGADASRRASRVNAICAGTATANSDKVAPVRSMFVGTPGMKSSIASKCVVQTPQLKVSAAVVIQTQS